MEKFSVLLVLCAGNSLVTDELPSQRPVSFDVFFDLRLNKRLSKQPWGWWSEMPSRSLWRHCNVNHAFRSIAGRRWTIIIKETDRLSTSWTLHEQSMFNTLRPRQNGQHFPEDIFKWIFLDENVWISIKIVLNHVLRGPIKNIPTLVQIMVWCWPGDKPLSEPMMVRLLTHLLLMAWHLFHSNHDDIN